MEHEDEAVNGCCQEMRRSVIDRRSLLKGLVAGAVAAPVLGLADAHIAYAADPSWNGDVLVVLSLRGGFDGLSAVVPWGDPGYYSARPDIGVPRSLLIMRPDDTVFGLHPGLSALTQNYLDGTFGAVVAAGLPAPNRSHFEATEEVEEAIPGSIARTGWLNRLLGQHAGSLAPLSAVQMGSTSMPTAYLGPVPAIGMSNINGFKLGGTSNASEREQWRTAFTQLHSRATAGVKGAMSTTMNALSTVASTASTAAGTGYPNSGTGNSLRDVARLIKNNASLSLGLKVVTLDVGNWDMHVGLGPPSNPNGWMYRQLTDLGNSLKAFADDLAGAALLGNVTLVTLSEFGRRVQQNDSGGLDHGWGNQMLLLGGHLSPGVQGTWAGLNSSTQGDVSVTTDYRSVLADILKNRMSATSMEVDAVFPPATSNLPYPGSPPTARSASVRFTSGLSTTFTTPDS